MNSFFTIDITFIKDFIDLVGKEDCCVHHDLLIKYGIKIMTGGTGDIKTITERNDGIEWSNFELSQFAYSLDYILHPPFCKTIIIRSSNTDNFADYYILLEKCIK